MKLTLQLLASLAAFSGSATALPLPPSPWRDWSCASTSTTDATRSFVEAMFSAVALDNFGASFAAVLGEELRWTVTGSSPIAGVYEPKSVYIEQVSECGVRA